MELKPKWKLDSWVPYKARSRDDLLLHNAVITGVLYRVLDLIAVGGSAVLAGVLLHGDLIWLNLTDETAIVISLLLTVIVFERFDLYVPWRGRSLVDQLGALTFGWAIVFGLLIVAAFLLQAGAMVSRLWAGTWFLLGYVSLLSARGIATLSLRALRSHGWNHKKVVVVGANDWGRNIAERVRSVDWLGFDIKCFVDPNPMAATDLDGIPFRGHYSALPEILAEGDVDEVWLCMPLHDREGGAVDHVDSVLHLLRHSLVNKRVVPDMTEMRLLERSFVYIAGIPFVNLSSSPYRGVNRVVKKLEDLVFGGLLLVLSAPLMLAIAVLVKVTSPGPVLFRQSRHGWDGKPFKVYKFRTMHLHREPRGRVTQAQPNDTRVTAVGRLLRSTSLDELPQFFNVLLGDMSIVGPRPHAVAHNEFYKDQIDSYMQRHKVKPGITGWAQVNGWRGRTDTIDKMRKRVEFDLYYIEHWSLWFDIKIILLTLMKGFRGHNAY